MQCKLRPWRLEDAQDLALALNDQSVQNNLRDGIPFPYTAEDGRSFIQAMHNSDPNQTFAFAVTVEDKAVGSIGVFRKDNIHAHTGEMGYYIAQPFWGKGLGTQAVGQMCEYVFTHTSIIRIFAEPFSSNIGSCSILEKNGFVCEGVLRCNALKCGRLLDMKLYALVKHTT